MIVLIIQARMGSSRLPGKVLKPLGGKPMLSFLLERLRHVHKMDKIVVATTAEPPDDAIAQECANAGVACFRGSERDVLSRFHAAAMNSGAQIVVRITADCPLIDPQLIDEAIATFVNSEPRVDYLSNMLEPSWPYGMAVEVFSAEALAEAHAEATDAAEREHVTPFIYWRPQRYALKSIVRSPNLSHLRWTVDTAEDYELVVRIVDELYPSKPIFLLNDVLALLATRPELARINAGVKQKTVAPSH